MTRDDRVVGGTTGTVETGAVCGLSNCFRQYCFLKGMEPLSLLAVPVVRILAFAPRTRPRLTTLRLRSGRAWFVRVLDGDDSIAVVVVGDALVGSSFAIVLHSIGDDKGVMVRFLKGAMVGSILVVVVSIVGLGWVVGEKQARPV